MEQEEYTLLFIEDDTVEPEQQPNLRLVASAMAAAVVTDSWKTPLTYMSELPELLKTAR